MDVAALVDLTAELLAAQADPAKAGPMAAYMKTEMSFYGVQSRGVNGVTAEVAKRFPPVDQAEYETAVRALWHLPHREEKHVAIRYARRFRGFITVDSLDLYRSLVVEGAWWDFVDDVAANLIGRALLVDRSEVSPIVETWITDENMWLRRTSIICQLRHKEGTDRKLLSRACIANMKDTEFFIRKAIGWALREYAKTDADWVTDFVEQYRETMSGLSVREATRHLH